MKLFLKDHLSIIIIYLITFAILPIIINRLDGFENHYKYFIFLAIVLLIGLLVIRYLRRKKMYTQLEKNISNKSNLLLHKPSSRIEKLYAQQLSAVYSTFLEEEEMNQEFLEEQQLLISHAVHQMKTPLSVIQLIVESKRVGSSNSLEVWDKVKNESDKINFSLNQLLLYSRSTKLISDLKIESIPLKKIAQEVINDLKEYFIEKEVFPKIQIEEGAILYSDRKWIKVVIYQILSNAIKYGEKNQVIYIQLKEGELSIQNKGETIPKGEINRIFNLFYTGSKGRENTGATGIGLYLVKKILTTLKHPYKMESFNNKNIFTINFSESIKTTAD